MECGSTTKDPSRESELPNHRSLGQPALTSMELWCRARPSASTRQIEATSDPGVLLDPALKKTEILSRGADNGEEGIRIVSKQRHYAAAGSVNPRSSASLAKFARSTREFSDDTLPSQNCY